MRIISFSINNFRGVSGGLDNNRITFQDTNTLFIYGQNNSGKSTILKAYDFFYRDAKPRPEDYFRQLKTTPIQFEIEVELDDLDQERVAAANPRTSESYKDYLNENSRISLKKEWVADKVTNYTWKPSEGSFVDVGYASIGLHRVFQSCLPKPIFIRAMPTEDEAKSVLNDILKAMAEAKLDEQNLIELHEAQDKIQALQEKMYRPDLIKTYESEVNSALNKLFPTTRIGITEKKERLVWSENKLGKEHDIVFQNLNEAGSVDVSVPDRPDLTGHGTIGTAIFTLLLMRDVAEEFQRVEHRKDYLVLFEEPELFLYPKVIRDLRELIYEVSADDTPYQVLCASHSPSMIDITKNNSSLIRLVKNHNGTTLHQVSDTFLKNASGAQTDADFKQKMYEVLRFNPFICEAFYSDEVILVEGPTEEIILRGYLQEKPQKRFIFILNCGTVNNIPFYQKVLSRFSIRYSVICDTDGKEIVSYDYFLNPLFATGIQKKISEQFFSDLAERKANVFRCHNTTFEPAHQAETVAEELRLPAASTHGKPFDANKYWQEQLLPNIENSAINSVPIIKFTQAITSIKLWGDLRDKATYSSFIFI